VDYRVKNLKENQDILHHATLSYTLRFSVHTYIFKCFQRSVLLFFVALFLAAFATGFAVAWILQSALKATAYLTALLVLAVVAAFVAWRHPLMSWAIAASVAALYAMAIAGVAAWLLWHNWPR